MFRSLDINTLFLFCLRVVPIPAAYCPQLHTMKVLGDVMGGCEVYHRSWRIYGA